MAGLSKEQATLEELGDTVSAIASTRLTPEEEIKYQNDMFNFYQHQVNNGQYRGDFSKFLEDQNYDYDIKGYWKEGLPLIPDDPRGHYTDKYKKPNHPTFSEGSIYAAAFPEQVGRWIKDANGNFTHYVAGSGSYWTPQGLARYMRRAERGITLIDPRVGMM